MPRCTAGRAAAVSGAGDREAAGTILPGAHHRGRCRPRSDRGPGTGSTAARAARRRPGFALSESNAADIADICTRLDGLPLALELAAARMDVLTPRALRERLSSSLDVLAGGPRDAAHRQQVLRREIEWSCDLLSEEARRVFRRLGVFPAGFDLAAVQAVCGDALDIAAELA